MTANGQLQTESKGSLSEKDGANLPLGSASSLTTISNLFERIKTIPSDPQVEEWAKEGKRLSEQLLKEYRAQNGYAHQ